MYMYVSVFENIEISKSAQLVLQITFHLNLKDNQILLLNSFIF